MPDDARARFASLIDSQLDSLYRTAYRLCRNRADAEDLVQEVCLRAFEHRASLGEHDEPKAWLLRVEYNLYVDGTRRSSRSPVERFEESAGSPETRPDDGPGPDDAIEGEQLAEQLSKVWHCLSPDQQALLALHAEGHSLQEITEITGVPLGALKARLHRARVRLGKLLVSNQARPSFAVAAGEST